MEHAVRIQANFKLRHDKPDCRTPNVLYGTTFNEAREYFSATKGNESLLEFAEKTFGTDNPKTRRLQIETKNIEYLIRLRNSVEHPGGHSGNLEMKNLTLDPNGKITEPTWQRIKNGRPLSPRASVRGDMETTIHNFLRLTEEIVVCWAAENLTAPTWMQLAQIPLERRNPQCPVKYVVTASQHLIDKINRAEKK